MIEREDWDTYFLRLTRDVSKRSPDQSSKVGALIVKDHRLIASGYNGFNSGINDNVPERHERPLKYNWMLHAEENAITHAARYGTSCDGASIYVTPFHPCSKCTRMIIASGINEVIVDQLVINPRFEDDFKIAKEMLTESKIRVRIIENKEIL